MAWRSLIISNPARLSLSRNQLIISQADEVSIPVEDISCIVIESLQVSLSAALLAALANSKVVIFVCDEKHLPCGTFTPFNIHSRQSRVIKYQLGMSKPFAKRCWQQIIRQKIINQAKCLDLLGMTGSTELILISKQVESGDISGREAYAARLYFMQLLNAYRRSDDNTTNAALNYGYAIIRGAVARSLVSYGYIPSLGIHHSNELNQYNLADDFIEVFRPLVDLWVATNIVPETQFTTEHRVGLTTILHHAIMIDDKRQVVLRAIDQMIGSFSAACQEKNPKLLKLPSLLPLEIHDYE